MNWKIPGWAAAGGVVISLAAGLAGGNRFGTVVLRAAVSALVAGALGLAGRHVLRRFLPDLAAGASQSAQPGVDILVDEEIALDPGRADGWAEQVPVAELQADDGLGLGELGPAEEEPFPAPAGEPGFEAGPSAAEEAFATPGELAGLEAAGESLEPLEAEELPSAESLEALAPAEPDDGLSGAIAEPGRRALKAEELEAQLDSVTKGQDPVSLAKAVRTFLRKDQEG